jgi:hypothetical protein
MQVMAAAALAVALHAALLLGSWDGASFDSTPAGPTPPAVAHVLVLGVPQNATPVPPALREEPAPPVAKLRPVERPAPSASQAMASAQSDDDEYVDSRRLTVRPSPIGDVVLPELPASDLKAALKAVMMLFIDNTGRVVRIRVESSNLPADAEFAVQQVFMQAPFHPGSIDGRAVKSRMRIEAGFDAAASSAGAPGSADPRRLSRPPGS